MLAALLSFPLLVALVGWVVSTPRWRGPATRTFDGKKFRNRLPTERSVATVLRDGWPKRVWPAKVTVTPTVPPPRVQGPDWSVTWVGHATVLVQADGVNLLTDPVWSRAAGPLGRFGPRRNSEPGVRLADLPKIDVVLLSHNHYDHLDIPTLRTLAERDHPVIVTPLGNGAFLRRAGIPGAVELDWDQPTSAAGLTVTCVEARHFSGRGLFDRDRSLWGAFVATFPSGKLYFGGDSGYGPHYADTGAAHGPLRLALLPIGAFLPSAIMRPVHTDPAEAVQAHLDLRAERSLGIHWGAFPLAADSYDEPVRRLTEARVRAGLSADDFFALPIGARAELPATGGVDRPAEPAPETVVAAAPELAPAGK